MTIASEANRSGPYACNGATTRFPFAFKIYDEAHIRVILTDPAGLEANLTLGTHYTVTGVGNDGVAVAAHLDPHLLEQAQEGADVVETRHVGEGDGLGGQQRRAQDGQRRVLGAGDGDFAGQADTALDQQFIHGSTGSQPSSLMSSAHWAGV